MTEALFREDAYLADCTATAVAINDGAVVLDRTIFYPMGGGQPGDTGSLSWDGGRAEVVDTRYGDDGAIRHVLADGASPPAVGTAVSARLDWDRRYRHMRMHTALHLLGAVLRYGVTGGNITAQRSRLDFDVQQGVDKDAVTEALAELVASDHAIDCRWISDEELDAQPELVRTMSVKPPRGAGRVRLLEIAGVDLQPCGGTHLRSTGEVGAVRVSKVEKKGRHNRRVHIVLDD
jgi:misacylated tRNA(Ala) deacylase